MDRFDLDPVDTRCRMQYALYSGDALLPYHTIDDVSRGDPAFNPKEPLTPQRITDIEAPPFCFVGGKTKFKTFLAITDDTEVLSSNTKARNDFNDFIGLARHFNELETGAKQLLVMSEDTRRQKGDEPRRFENRYGSIKWLNSHSLESLAVVKPEVIIPSTARSVSIFLSFVLSQFSVDRHVKAAEEIARAADRLVSMATSKSEIQVQTSPFV
jgi:hypothetical protein